MKNQRAYKTWAGAFSTALLAAFGICGVARAGVVVLEDNLQLSRNYASPPGLVMAYGGTTWVRNFTVSSPTNRVAPPESGTITVSSFFDIFTEISTDGGATWLPRRDSVATVGAQITFDHQTGDTRYYNTLMQTLAVSDPDDPFRMRLDTTPPGASSGGTSITPDSGFYRIDSFFDIFTELSVDGGSNWVAANARSLDGGATWTPVPEGASLRIEAIPEPSGFGLILLSGFLALCRRCRRGAATMAGVAMMALPAEATLVIQDSISLASLRNTGSAFRANDFHVRFKATQQSFANPSLPVWSTTTMVPADLNPNGYYARCGGITLTSGPTVTIGADGYIDIEWNFADTWIDANEVSMFGFTNFGGIRFDDVQWWWTYNGTNVRDLPEVWQDWFYEDGELVDRIRNGTNSPVSLTRTTGSQTATVGIADVAGMTTPPNPVVINPPENRYVLQMNGIVDATWEWPSGDPSYYMSYQFAEGSNDITFTNAANLVVPEPSTVFLTLAGLALMIRRWRWVR